MAALTTLHVELTVEDSQGVALERNLLPQKFVPYSNPYDGQVTAVTLTGSAFTALSVPTGASLLLLEIPVSATSLILKGITGDTGINLVPSSNFLGLPAVIPLGASPSVGIQNNGATVTIQAVFV